MDFSAWFQVYLGGRWYDFDARYNTPRIGRILMAVGRDAADVALMTTFGKHSLEMFLVVDEEIEDESSVAEEIVRAASSSTASTTTVTKTEIDSDAVLTNTNA